MEEEKDRTTPPQAEGAKHRRRRKKTNHPSGTAMQQENPESRENTAAAVEQAQPAEKPETPQTPDETVIPADEPMQQEKMEAEPHSAETEPQAEKAETEMPAPEKTAGTEPGSAESETPSEKPQAPAGKAEAKPEDETDSAEPEAAQQPQTVPQDSPEDKSSPVEKAGLSDGEEEASAQAEEAAEPAEPPEEDTAPEKLAAEPEQPGEAPARQEEEPAPGTPETEEAPSEETSEEPPLSEDELPEEDEKRLSDMTRTVQLSVEQIMARVSAEEGEPEPEPAEEPQEEAEQDSLSDSVHSGLSGMAKWLLLVAFVVLVIAGFGVAWLYRSATPDMLPQITVTFAGQTVEPTAYKWKVPVVGNVFKRTYADTLQSTPVALEAPVEQVSPDFVVSPSDYRTELTVTDSQDQVLFEGDVDAFSSFRFTANGTYTAKLVVHSDASSVPGDATVTGTETWQFSFTVGVRPSVRLSTTTVNQGSVVAVRVGDTLDGQPPQIQTELKNAGFFAASSGWVCYLPIPWNQAAGTQTVEVSAGGYTETLELKIRATEWEYKDYYSDSQRVSPYIGENDLPAEVQKLLSTSESAIAWSDGNFVQPFLNTLDVELAYGTTEYVGRSYSERGSNNGAGGRTTTNLILNTSRGELLIAPASGKVLLAKDLGGNYGYTLVIDHGAGVKSIFYNLQGVSVTAGTQVKQGQVLATCGRTTVAEMRIGTVPIDPLQVWRGQCDGLKNY